MGLTILAILGSLGLFIGMTLAGRVGRMLGKRRLARTGAAEHAIGAAEAAIFGLLGLLLAFTFSGAAARFEHRRALITQEANAIGTAWLRLDLLPAESQPALRDLFRTYLDARLRSHAPPGPQREAAVAEAGTLQDRIWQSAHTAAGTPGHPPPAVMLLLPALNEMFDMASTRLAAHRDHPPLVIYALLAVLCLLASMLLGFGAASQMPRPRFYPGVFAAILALVTYVIVDLEFPRQGLIRVDDADGPLVALRATFGS